MTVKEWAILVVAVAFMAVGMFQALWWICSGVWTLLRRRAWARRTVGWWLERFPPPEREWPGGRCAACGAARPSDGGHDPCIPELPGVAYACCGHGVEPGYVQFTDGRILRGYFEKCRDTDDPFPESSHELAFRRRHIIALRGREG